MSIVGMRDSDAFYSTVAEALGRELLEVEESQIGNSYKNLMKEVPGHFASQSDLRKRMRRKPGKGTGIEAGSKPDQADGEAANAPDIKSVRSTVSKNKKPQHVTPILATPHPDRPSQLPSTISSYTNQEVAAWDSFVASPGVCPYYGSWAVEPTFLYGRSHGEHWYTGQVQNFH